MRKGSGSTITEKQPDSKTPSGAAEAASLLQPPSLEWAFAVNHCAYIGYHADIFKRERDEFYEALNSIWRLHKHYRFADTLACPFTIRAGKLIHEFGIDRLIEDSSLNEEFRECRENLLEADKTLSVASPTFGDEEVETHRTQTRNWLGDIRRGTHEIAKEKGRTSGE